MAVSTNMFRSWRRPKAVMRELMAVGQREDRLVGYVMGACLLIYIAKWPRLMRADQFELYGPDGASDFQMNAGISFFAIMIVWPLALYGIAALSHLMAKPLRTTGTHYGARLALFWALLASTPLLLLYGLTMGFIGAGPAASLVGLVWLCLFMWIWSQSFWVAEKEGG